MKVLLSKLIEEYKKVSQDWRMVSRFGSFIIAIFTLLSLYDVGWAIYYNQTVLEENTIYVNQY